MGGFKICTVNDSLVSPSDRFPAFKIRCYIRTKQAVDLKLVSDASKFYLNRVDAALWLARFADRRHQIEIGKQHFYTAGDTVDLNIE